MTIKSISIMNAQVLVYSILLGGLLGIIGQGIRIIVGIKKTYNEVNGGKSTFSELFDSKRLLISLLIGFIAGILASFSLNIVGSTNVLSNEIILSLISSGYAGTDFIEGFMRNADSIKNKI